MIGRGAGAVAVIVGVLVIGLAGPAFAAPGETIRGYDTTIEVRADGDLDVVETIAYDFGAGRRHGIYRKIPVRLGYDDTRDRVYPVTGIAVRMDGAAVPFVESPKGDYRLIRIGDQNLTVTGTHTYVIRYTVRGALTGFPDRAELAWNAVGTEWDVPIASVTATVRTPAPVGAVNCFTGARGSDQRCAGHEVAGSTASFRQPSLNPGEALTVVVGLPVGSVARTGPILEERGAVRVTRWTVGGAVGLAVLSMGVAVAFAWRVGRDRRYVGVLPGLVPEFDDPVVEQRKPLLGAPPVSVEFTPPDAIRPGQVGTLIDERADPRDVTATIIDFAVRKLMHIRRLRNDWELTKLVYPKDGLLPYERTLFRALFAHRDKVRVSELKGTIGVHVRKAREQLDADLVRQGWYKRSPRDTRYRVRRLALLLLLAALGAIAVLAATTHLALLGLGPIAGALALVTLAGRFPARTGRGSAMLERVRGLRLYIATAEVEQLRFQERVNIFSRYLPYAMVFGLAEHWIAAFGGIQALADDGLYWYDGVGITGQFTYPDTFGAFDAIVTGSAPSGLSSSTGYSGGYSDDGGGGGGGGSW